jgi:Methyltransferase domain
MSDLRPRDLQPPDLSPIVELVDFSAVEPIAKALWPGPRRDYVSPGLADPGLMRFYPDLAEGAVAELQWPYLRKDAPHIWRRDLRGKRNPYIGVLSLDEATLLYNNALSFRGRRGLEIGCHYAWSSAHLVAAGLDIDVIDPALGHADQMRDVRASLARIGAARLWAGFSPSVVPAVRAVRPEPWSFAFIDGYHEGDAPRQDAEAVRPLMAEDALVMFHDLVSPHVAAGLAAFAEAGWNVGLYNTMQVMGAAWRGAARPVAHVADRDMPAPAGEHLRRYAMLSR